METVFNRQIVRVLIQAEIDYLKAGDLKRARLCYNALWEYVKHKECWFAC